VDHRADAQEQLDAANAGIELTAKLRPELDAVMDQLKQLRIEAERLADTIEHVWDGPIRDVTRSHDRLLAKMFPKGVPPFCYIVGSEISGLVGAMAAFHDIVVLLHNTPERYPIGTDRPRPVPTSKLLARERRFPWRRLQLPQPGDSWNTR
jgi:hypothetical protein